MTDAEKNRRVAEKIMGWTPVRRTWAISSWGETWALCNADGEPVGGVGYCPDEEGCWSRCPDFGDWPGVPLLLARLNALGYSLTIMVRDNDGLAMVELDRYASTSPLPPGMKPESYGEADTVPLALRDAALALVGGGADGG